MNKILQSSQFASPSVKTHNFKHNSTSKQIINTQSKHYHHCHQYPYQFNTKNIKTAANSNNQQNNQEYQCSTSERLLLTYSNTTEFNFLQDYTVYLQKLLHLMSSKQNIKNHASQSLSLHGYNETMSAEIGNILSKSFIQYIQIAKNIDSKLVKGQIILTNSFQQPVNKIKEFTEEQHKKEVDGNKIKSKAKIVQFDVDKMMSILMKEIESEFSKIIQKTIVFQSQIYLRLGQFQDSLINVTMLRNNLLQDRINDNLWQQNCRKYQLQNKKLKSLLKEKQMLIQQYALKQKKMESSWKNEQVKDLKKMLKDVRKELEEQKLLYDNMIEKNLNLQKQLYLLSNGHNDSNKQNQSFQIIEKSQINFLAESSFASIPGQSCEI